MSEEEQERRFSLGIIFKISPGWMGGVIYVLNIIKILNFLDDREKPRITIFYKSDLEDFVNSIQYPYLSKIEWPFPSVLTGTIMSIISRNDLFTGKILEEYFLDAVFPLNDLPVRTKTNVILISWWADLQHKYYPEFFSGIQILGRNLRIKKIIKNCDKLIVSSNSVLNDFKRFYNLKPNLKAYIFHFVSVIDDFEDTSIDILKTRYALPDDYFFVSNQFHKHKNHRVLLKALASLDKEKQDVFLVMTGKMPEAEQSPYMRELHSLIEENSLRSNICFLGVIPRKEQLLLMKYSRAVIQPSLFEGWSTVIEDAISLQVPVIASSLDVNMEQLGPDGCYFDPDDHNTLAKLLISYPKRDPGDSIYPDYKKRIRDAAKTLINIIKD